MSDYAVSRYDDPEVGEDLDARVVEFPWLTRDAYLEALGEDEYERERAGL